LIIENSEIKRVMATLDVMLRTVFFLDFLFLFFNAPSKRKYMATWGWIDLLSSIPLIDPFRWGRLARIFRILKILRAVKSLSVIGSSVVDPVL